METPRVTCRGCGMGACSTCLPLPIEGWSFLCSPCGSVVDACCDTPAHLLKAKARKKALAVSQDSNPPETVQDPSLVLDQTSTLTQDLTLPGGQLTPAQSTQTSSQDKPIHAVNVGLDWTFVSQPQGDLTPEAGDQGEVLDPPAPSQEDSSENAQGEVLEPGFVDPPARTRANAKKDKRKASSQALEPSQGSPQASCKYFLKGNCKFGFFGKGKDGQGRCSFTHPKVCAKLMDHGTGPGGCQSESCKFVHPRMCRSSLSHRTCSNLKGGARCTAGYHVRGTKASASQDIGLSQGQAGPSRPAKPTRVSPSQDSGLSQGRAGPLRPAKPTKPRARAEDPNVGAERPHPLPQTPQGGPPAPNLPQGGQQSALTAFFGELVRAEVYKLMVGTGQQWPQSPNPGAGLVAPKRTPLSGAPVTTLETLGTLLSLLGGQ
jgi:hypothetical protein